jgi:hypothetical protein
MYRYSCRYRRIDNGRRIYRITLDARTADEARAKIAIHDPLFGSTVESPKRRGQIVPEQDDDLTASKAREFVEWRGTSVEVVD